MNRLVQIEGLCKHYPLARGLFRKPSPLRAVEDVSLTMNRGRNLGLVGESGCGKSTLGRSVLRLVEPTSGRVTIDGIDVTSLSGRALLAFRRRAQMIFQDPYGSLNPRMTVRQALCEPLRIHRLCQTKKQENERLCELLSNVGLPERSLQQYPHEFSGGQRQRIVIARALAVSPSLLVCDEPVSALDVSIQAQIVNLLLDVQQQTGLTYLFISHDLKVVKHLCDEIAVMYVGRLVEHATAEQLFLRPRHPYTQALIAAIPRPPDAASLNRLSPRLRGEILAGETPSLQNPPSGCAFHPRCRRYEHAGRPEICRTQRPQLTVLDPAPDGSCPTRVACHLQNQSQTE